MKYLIPVLAVLLMAGCQSHQLHAQAIGPASVDTDLTYFAVSAEGDAYVQLAQGADTTLAYYTISAGVQRAWKRTSFLFWKTGSWIEVDYEEAMRAIYPPDGVPPERPDAPVPLPTG